MKSLFDELLVAWAAGVITWAVVRTFSATPPDIPGTGGTVAALGAVIGLLGTAIALYRWVNRRRDDPDEGKP
ncbi:hypothetical protein [Thioalbus denitrificans]|uniref:Uncharacterized protein n=1 Tax=Thioalbus denitrificans TaxID=547122 RepID=A0A369CEU4_9GAMM|nr:hypothetical protein [Thioalbus denitrificans]RCX32091.1 hypothetical protein DFQ59_102444 [Thioalbus denitrificans]